MARNFPDLLLHNHQTIDYPAPSLECGPSKSAAAISSADSGWRKTLIDAEMIVSDHLREMSNLASQFNSIDTTLSRSLDQTW